jgi:hypothetical protein
MPNLTRADPGLGLPTQPAGVWNCDRTTRIDVSQSDWPVYLMQIRHYLRWRRSLTRDTPGATILNCTF